MRKIFFKILSVIICCVFTVTTIMPIGYAQGVVASASGGVNLPAVGTMLRPSPAYVPPTLKGIIIHPENAFQFDFILDSGDADMDEAAMKAESEKLIKYFLTSLTLPEDDLWVNLSPYEADRIIPDEFGRTEMGQVLLEQDYLLKQLTASLMNPEEELGEEFWNKVYEEAYAKYGVTDIPVNTFNKVWIVPSKALVYENVDRAFVVESHLKVMLEEDYLAMANMKDEGRKMKDVKNLKNVSRLTSNVLRNTIIPAIEQEVNHGQHFAQLRQVYHSFILASWYKKNLKNSVLNKSYSDHKKIGGLETGNEDAKKQVYEKYLNAFKAGTYDLIKEEYDVKAQEIMPRKYFSGGVSVKDVAMHSKVKNFNGMVDGLIEEWGKNIFVLKSVFNFVLRPVKKDEFKMIRPLFWKKKKIRVKDKNGKVKNIGEELIQNRYDLNTNRWQEDKRLKAVVIYPTSDMGKAFNNNTVVIESLIYENFNVLYYEVSDVNQLVDALKSATKFEDVDNFIPADVLVIGGHGNRDFIKLGSIFRKLYKISLESKELLFEKEITNILKKERPVILQSCCVGEGKQEKDNIVNMFAEIFPQASQIIGPTFSTTVKKMDFIDGRFYVEYFRPEEIFNKITKVHLSFIVDDGSDLFEYLLDERYIDIYGMRNEREIAKLKRRSDLNLPKQYEKNKTAIYTLLKQTPSNFVVEFLTQFEDLPETYEVNPAIEGQVNKNDKASITSHKGGVDFNDDYLDIQTQGNAVDASMFTEGLENINIDIGLVPFIYGIAPVMDINQLFGREDGGANDAGDLSWHDYRHEYCRTDELAHV